MATNKSTHTQTRPPSKPQQRSQMDPERHYVLVEEDNPYVSTYSSPLGKMLDKVSLTNPAEQMYTDHGYDPVHCTERRQRLLSCSKADFDIYQKGNEEEAIRLSKSRGKEGLNISSGIKGKLSDLIDQARED